MTLEVTHLEALKDEIIYGQRLAVDEAGRIHIRIGDIWAVAELSLVPLAATIRRF